jgi:hypothetical protein
MIASRFAADGAETNKSVHRYTREATTSGVHCTSRVHCALSTVRGTAPADSVPGA